MSKDPQFFKFNLIPPKTKEELVVLEERDNSIFYSFILIFFGVLIYIILTLVQNLVILPRLVINKQVAQEAQNEITNYNRVRELNGELYTKAQSLDFILEKDIKLTQLLEIADQLKSEGNLVIQSYSREGDGKFTLLFGLQDKKDVNIIFKNASSISVIKDFYFERLGNQSGLVATFSFYISNINNV